MKVNKDITDVKNEFGEIVLDVAIINLLNFGINSYEKTTLKEQLNNIHEVFDKLEKENKAFPIALNFVLNVLNCQFALLDLDIMQILTYFPKPNFSKTNLEE